MLERTERGVRLQGAVTFASVSTLLAQGNLLMGAAAEAVEVDLSAVETADSAALSLLLEWQRQAARAGGSLVLRGIPEGLRKLVGLYGLGDLVREA